MARSVTRPRSGKSLGMLDLLKNLVHAVTGGDSRSQAATKAAATRKREAAARSEAARKAAATRRQRASERSAAAKRGARTRTQRDARVEAMVDATRQD
jgi:hypothetical protein